jgi:hypothetical protein
VRECKRTKINRNTLLQAKRRYKERCREKKQKGEREEKELKEIKTEKEVQLVAKKTGTVRIKLTHFCNFSIV